MLKRINEKIERIIEKVLEDIGIIKGKPEDRLFKWMQGVGASLEERLEFLEERLEKLEKLTGKNPDDYEWEETTKRKLVKIKKED
jgi:predicted ribonuclease YlaK